MAVSKLKNDPEVIALIEAAVAKSRKVVVRAAVKAVKDVAAGFIADAKTGGNKGALNLLKAFAGDAAAAVGNVGAAGSDTEAV